MILLGTLAVTMPIVVFGYFYIKINSIYESYPKVEANSSNQNFVINDAIISDNITNILLIGTDARNKDEQGRSDAMMIATIDEKHKCLKLTSLARDTYIEIPGHGEQKLNHAYSYGGADLLIKTLEHNLSIDIANYMTVNFNSFVSIIDALGGVTVEVKESELSELNKYIPECYEASSNKNNSSMKLVEKPGIQILNGYQALSYSRIRKNDSSLERDNRQRKVLQSLINEASNMSVLEIPKVLNAVFPHVKTNMNFNDIVKFGKKVLKMGNFELSQLAFPMQEYSKNSRINGKGAVIEFNKEKCLPILHEFIFEDQEFLNKSEIYNSYREKDENNLDNNIDSNINNEHNSVLDGYIDQSNTQNNSSNLNNTMMTEDYFNNNYYGEDNLNTIEELENINTDSIPFV